MEINTKLYGKVGDTFYATGYDEQELETLSTQHAKMVEVLTKVSLFKQYQRVEDFVSIDEIESLLSSIKKGGSDAV